MLVKIAFVLAALALINANPLQSRSSALDMVSMIALEEPCVLQGGICMRVEDCEPSNLVTMQAVLCPNQRHLGVECCYN